jgi:hypothetical protein
MLDVRALAHCLGGGLGGAASSAFFLMWLFGSLAIILIIVNLS